MSVLVNKDPRVVVQGITGKEGSFQTRRCIDGRSGTIFALCR